MIGSFSFMFWYLCITEDFRTIDRGDWRRGRSVSLRHFYLFTELLDVITKRFFIFLSLLYLLQQIFILLFQVLIFFSVQLNYVLIVDSLPHPAQLVHRIDPSQRRSDPLCMVLVAFTIDFKESWSDSLELWPRGNRIGGSVRSGWRVKGFQWFAFHHFGLLTSSFVGHLSLVCRNYNYKK